MTMAIYSLEGSAAPPPPDVAARLVTRSCVDPKVRAADCSTAQHHERAWGENLIE